MKFLVKMMIPEEIIIAADGLYDADEQARRLRNALDDAKGNHTVILLSVYPVGTQNGNEDTKPVWRERNDYPPHHRDG